MRNSPKDCNPFIENGRNFKATKEISRDFSNSQDNTDRGSMSDQAFACSASSVESLPSASGSSKFKKWFLQGATFLTSSVLNNNKFSIFIGTQALVRPGSPQSSISTEDRTHIMPICKAKALVDSLPTPYDKDALKFKVCVEYYLILCLGMMGFVR